MNDDWRTIILKTLRKPITTKVADVPVTVPLFVIIIIFLTVAVFLGRRDRINRDKWLTLVSQQYGYSIDYPANWSIHTHGDGGSRGSDFLRAEFAHFFTSSVVYIHEQAMEEPTSIKAAEWSERIIERQGGYDWSELKEGEIGRDNYPALVRTYVQNDFLGRHILNKAVYIATDKRIFMLQFSAYERRYDEAVMIFDNMLNSFQLIDIGVK